MSIEEMQRLVQTAGLGKEGIEFVSVDTKMGSPFEGCGSFRETYPKMPPSVTKTEKNYDNIKTEKKCSKNDDAPDAGNPSESVTAIVSESQGIGGDSAGEQKNVSVSRLSKGAAHGAAGLRKSSPHTEASIPARPDPEVVKLLQSKPFRFCLDLDPRCVMISLRV